jgi:hypothetical protein
MEEWSTSIEPLDSVSLVVARFAFFPQLSQDNLCGLRGMHQAILFILVTESSQLVH